MTHWSLPLMTRRLPLFTSLVPLSRISYSYSWISEFSFLSHGSTSVHLAGRPTLSSFPSSSFHLHFSKIHLNILSPIYLQPQDKDPRGPTHLPRVAVWTGRTRMPTSSLPVAECGWHLWGPSFVLSISWVERKNCRHWPKLIEL